jgi:hypothetical protein
MVGTEEVTMDLPDIKVEGYEFLFTEHLHALDLDIADQNVNGPMAGDKDVASKGKDDIDQTSKEGQAVASAFRVLLALLRYGTETTKSAVLGQIRDTEMLRSLICLADDVTNGRWYPANVGPNLLLIMQDLCRLPSTVMEEQPTMVILYDMITIMLRSALAMLQPKLDLVIAIGKSAVGYRLRPMGEQEELLMRNVVLTYRVMCETITHMRFADAVQVNTASRELALQCLLPIAQMSVLIRYLYYENLLSYGVWQQDEGEPSIQRGGTTQELTKLLAEHLCINEDTRWELLEVFSRYEVIDKLALRTCPAFLDSFCLRRWHPTPPCIPTRIIAPSVVCCCRSLIFANAADAGAATHVRNCTAAAPRRAEDLPRARARHLRLLGAHGVRPAPHGAASTVVTPYSRYSLAPDRPSKRKRLIVVSSRAYYILKEPLGQRCTACDPHLFCPAGPEPVQRLNFRDVHAITIGHGVGQRIRILWSRHRVTLDKPAKTLQFSVTTLSVADRIAQTIHALNPLPRPPPMEADLQTERVIREKLLEPVPLPSPLACALSRARAMVGLLCTQGKEQVRLYLQLEKIDLGTGRVLPRVAVITTLSVRNGFYPERLSNHCPCRYAPPCVPYSPALHSCTSLWRTLRTFCASRS